MKLIKRLGCLETHYSHGLFLCSYCLQKVIKMLNHGKIDKSCGCNRGQKQNKNNYKHGETKSKLYKVWSMIKQRCLNKNNKFWKDYGGRGITICDEWKNSFESFRDWSMNHGYKKGLEIDRIENNKGYYPDNCRWTTHKENCNNRKR